MRILCKTLGVAAWIITATPLAAQSPKPTELLPATTVIYAEGADANSLRHLPIVESLTQSPMVRELWKTPPAMQLRGGITIAEVALGERLHETLTKLTSQGWCVAVDRQSQGAMLWMHAQDKATCRELYQKLLSLAEADAKSKGNQLKKAAYRDIDAYEFNGTIVANLDDYLLLCNKSELIKKIVDHYREPVAPRETLAGNDRFKKFGSSSLAEAEDAKSLDRPIARAWVDMQQLRDAGVGKKVFEGPHDNFGVELLIGGLVATLRNASTLEARLTAEGPQLHLRFTTPVAKSGFGDRYDYFFGQDAKGEAPTPIELSGTQVNICLYRDLAQLWQRAGDLFGQKTNDQLAQAETTLSTLFSGRDFANDILGAIRPELQLIFADQEFGKNGAPIPQIKLPAFALVTRLRDPGTMQPQMKRIFMSLIGFLNITSAMNQQPQLDLEAFRIESGWEVTATYAVEADRPKNWIVPVQYNFSPTLWLSGEHAVIASTTSLARSIGEKLRSTPDGASPTSSTHLNSFIRLDGDLIKSALAANRQQLISQNMVEKGHTQEEAESEIDLLLRIVELVKNAKVKFEVGSEAALDLKLELATGK